MREHSRAWLLLTALLFVALVEVKTLMAGQLMCSLALAAVVYLIFFSNADLFKIAGCTAIAAIPLVGWVLLKNESGGRIVTKFEPWLYVSHAMQTLGLGNWLSRPVCFRVCSAANLPCGLPWAACRWRSRNPHCNNPPETRWRSSVHAWNFRGKRRSHRTRIHLYARRMDLPVQIQLAARFWYRANT